MDSEISKHEKNLRDVAISRRGGVRTRGGRLPPINMREITQVVGTKKVVIPNIPQRRVKREAKQDTSGEPFRFKAEPTDDSSRPRRTRPAKVFLQTDRSFLAEGPALRIKKGEDEEMNLSNQKEDSAAPPGNQKEDSAAPPGNQKEDSAAPPGNQKEDSADTPGNQKEDSAAPPGNQEEVSAAPPGSLGAPQSTILSEQGGLDVGYSIPRFKVKEQESGIKYDPDTIKDILGNYNAESFYEDYLCDKPPHRFPLLKQELFPKIKAEFDTEDDIKVKIKKEDTEDGESEEIKTDFKKSLKTTDYFRGIQDKNKLILLKLPSNLSFMKKDVTTVSDDKVEKNSKEVESETKETDTQNEGYIGKLRFMRSGRVKLVLGDIELDVTEDKPLGSYMEVATVTLQQNMADLNILGTIDRKMTFSPSIDKMVNEDKQLSLGDVQ